MLGDGSASAAEASPRTVDDDDAHATGRPERSGTRAGCSAARAVCSCGKLRVRGSAAPAAAMTRSNMPQPIAASRAIEEVLPAERPLCPVVRKWTHGRASVTPRCFERTCSAQCPIWQAMVT
eukprot:scaffold44670_cov60-Phaeocystis_antarctica.AAC.1